VILLLGLRIALNEQSHGDKLSSVELYEAESLVAGQHLLGWPILAHDDDRHGFVVGVVIKGGAIGSVLTRLRW